MDAPVNRLEATMAQEIAELRREVAALRGEREDLRARIEEGVREWDKERAEHVNDVACGERRLLKVEAALASARADADFLARLVGSSLVLATLDTLAGEGPVEKPTHALPATVLSLVRDRDAAEAALSEAVALLNHESRRAERIRARLARVCQYALTSDFERWPIGGGAWSRRALPPPSPRNDVSKGTERSGA
jgi:predicted RNase H-like nuclease (RuvC/YqgF family)